MTVSADNDFVDYVLELLGPLGPVQARRMFGGWGIYLHEQMFALVSDGRLYFKTDRVNRAEFTGRGLAPFRYRRAGRTVTFSYYEAPAEALDDGEALLPWAQLGLEAALRAAGAGNRPA